MLFGCKRFGDWIQVYLAKKYYFMLETTDFYCKLYELLVGATTMIKDELYNYNPSNDMEMPDYRIIDKNNTIYQQNESNGIIYKGLQNVKTTTINRDYFEKYMKYKSKYIELKKSFSL